MWAGNLSSGTNWVWYSDINDPETFGANNYFVFGADIEGISQYMGTLVVYTDISISQLIPTGNSDTPYRRVDIAVSNAGGVGPVSGRSIINIPNAGQCFVRNDGVWLFDGTRNITKISHALDGLRYWDTIMKSRLPQCFVVPNWMRDEIWFVWALGASQTDNNTSCDTTIRDGYGMDPTMGPRHSTGTAAHISMTFPTSAATTQGPCSNTKRATPITHPRRRQL